jgi:hypothetical protein
MSWTDKPRRRMGTIALLRPFREDEVVGSVT